MLYSKHIAMVRLGYNVQQILSETLTSGYAMTIGSVSSIVGYFLPVKDTVHVLFIFFVLDVIFGFWAARKKGLQNDVKVRFSASIIWKKTVPKMLVSFLLILTAQMLDSISPGGVITIRESVGWFISGIVLSSVWQNFFIITKWKVIQEVKEMWGKKVKEKTGIDVKNLEDDNK